MTADQICATPSRRNLRLKGSVSSAFPAPPGHRLSPTSLRRWRTTSEGRSNRSIHHNLSIEHCIGNTGNLPYIFKGWSAGHLVVKDRLRYRIPYSSTHSRLYRLRLYACMLYTQISVAAVSHEVNLKQIRPDHTVNSVEVGPPVRHP